MDEINTLLELTEAVCDARTGGYEAEMIPRRVRCDQGHLWLTVKVTDTEPGSPLPGTYWFWADGTVMQVV